jgi:hypothetical protein
MFKPADTASESESGCKTQMPLPNFEKFRGLYIPGLGFLSHHSESGQTMTYPRIMGTIDFSRRLRTRGVRTSRSTKGCASE